jgi:DNA replication protein
MSTFDGFPQGMQSVSVPCPILGPLIEDIYDMSELKCTLRYFWHIGQTKGHVEYIAVSALENDQVLLRTLGSLDEIRRGFRLAIDRGVFVLYANTDGGQMLQLNRAESHSTMINSHKLIFGSSQRQPSVNPPTHRPNIFILYEANIGIITPLLAEELKDAEKTYPAEWIEPAFKEAVEHNKRNWRYISRILERWTTEGRGSHGKPGRYPQTLSATEYLRRSRPTS